MTRRSSEAVPNLYLLSCALLFTHEVDSGYWQEWNLFGIPGGNQVFVILNLVLFILALYGFRQVEQKTDRATFFSLLVAAGGVFAFAIHILFILLGHAEFTEPVSLIILGALMFASIMLLRTTWQERGTTK